MSVTTLCRGDIWTPWQWDRSFQRSKNHVDMWSEVLARIWSGFSLGRNSHETDLLSRFANGAHGIQRTGTHFRMSHFLTDLGNAWWIITIQNDHIKKLQSLRCDFIFFWPHARNIVSSIIINQHTNYSMNLDLCDNIFWRSKFSSASQIFDILVRRNFVQWGI